MAAPINNHSPFQRRTESNSEVIPQEQIQAADQFVPRRGIPAGGRFALNIPPRQMEPLTLVSLVPTGSVEISNFRSIVSRVADTNVYVGSLRDAGNIEALKAGEFTHVLNLASERGHVARNPNDLKAAGIQERRIPLRDSTEAAQDFRNFLPQALEFIRDARKGGGNILIHCHQGISRSVSVAIADRMHQLAEAFNGNPEKALGAHAPNFYHQALAEVQEARERAHVEAMPNWGFSEVLEELNGMLGGSTHG